MASTFSRGTAFGQVTSAADATILLLDESEHDRDVTITVPASASSPTIGRRGMSANQGCPIRDTTTRFTIAAGTALYYRSGTADVVGTAATDLPPARCQHCARLIERVA